MKRLPLIIVVVCLPALVTLGAVLSDDEPLRLPSPGDYQLRALTPTMLELTLVTRRETPSSSLGPWDFVGPNVRLRLPAPSEFVVTAGAQTNSVKRVGFKRRVIYAPLKTRDLRIANWLYLELDRPLPEGTRVQVLNPSRKLWPRNYTFETSLDPARFSPVLHVSQSGYSPQYPMTAMVGYFLGSLGELSLQTAGIQKFAILDAQSGNSVFTGELRTRADRGFPNGDYQKVMEADFSALKQAGQYRLSVPGLGVSYPFAIGETTPGVWARTYALGLYHQRCGAANAEPYTRFVHAPCHTNLVEVPTIDKKFDAVNDVLENESANFRDEPRHRAPQLKNVNASLYPFVNPGPLAIRGGHHDAGDYSKYTINSAGFIHHLMTAVDAFQGVKDLDNLGLPESGDGISDVLQLARWEADFLARMQDADGGFYFLVYPRDRRYEDNVLPDAGDPQVVFPKTTAVTAAAVAALAQCASSPQMKARFPEAAADYLAKARKGWDFLERALARYGPDASYQKITHYGQEFLHDDELTWAACELFVATGEEKYHERVREWLKPKEPATRRWGWWRLYEAYGCAIRSYALAQPAGKLNRDQLDQELVFDCETELIAAAEDQARRAEQSAYGISFPVETKRARSAGWFFAADAAFDLAVALQLQYPSRRDPRPRYAAALVSNLAYEQGRNPVNVSYLTGVGWKRQREIVHQYAQNDRRVLPPDGIPLGCIQAGFGWLDRYKQEPGSLSYPPDGSDSPAYPFYDRWSDAFNLTQEFVILQQARGLASTAWLMAQTSLKTQHWKSAKATIRTENQAARAGIKYFLEAPGLDLSPATIVWEADGQDPTFARALQLPRESKWVEAEALLPDGRRLFGVLPSGSK